MAGKQIKVSNQTPHVPQGRIGQVDIGLHSLNVSGNDILVHTIELSVELATVPNFERCRTHQFTETFEE